MIDEDCKECNGTGFHEIQIAVDDFKRVPCGCSYLDEDEEYEILKYGYIDESFDDMVKRNGL